MVVSVGVELPPSQLPLSSDVIIVILSSGCIFV